MPTMLVRPRRSFALILLVSACGAVVPAMPDGSPDGAPPPDGTAFANPTTISSAGNLSSLSGTGARDVWAVGQNEQAQGLIAHFDGTMWTTTASGLPDALALWGAYAISATDVWAVGEFQGQ